MAPARVSPRQEAGQFDETGRDDFEENLAEFAKQRGIPIDFNTRVAAKHIDLYRLFKVVNARGGYDAVSGEKLAWRKLGHEFELGTANAAAYAFALKTTYYKNLAAYELKFVHGKEPPPIDIMENLTAKGGDILNRSVDNFQPPQKNANLVNGGEDSDSEGAKTPKDDKMDIDEPGSGAGRSTRGMSLFTEEVMSLSQRLQGLRQQPPQRVLFQPDVTSSRQTRHSSGASPQPAFPTPVIAATSNPNNSAFSIASYEPRPQMPLSLRPVMTPNNNYPLFQAHVKKLRDAKLATLGLAPSTSVMKPGAGFEGPNIYVRILNSLRCPVPAEQDYALHHMVKISHERGDKYRFDSFPGLADGLIERLLSVSSLFYDVEWKVSFTQDYDEYMNTDEILDGIDGTPDIIERIQRLKRIDAPDELQSGDFAHRMNKMLEAALTLRNLSMLDENALYLSEMAQLRDFLSIALNLPQIPSTVEMKHYALDVAEQVVRYWRMSESDPLYRSLRQIVNEGSDRGAIITALRALCRISMNIEDANSLPGVEVSLIQRLFEWIVLEDEEFTSVCLDFLYQFTALPKNVFWLFANCQDFPWFDTLLGLVKGPEQQKMPIELTPFVTQLSRLLQYRASAATIKTILSKSEPSEPATEVSSVPKELLDQFLRHEEPERSKLWLRSVFEEDSQSHITQIALWQAYQHRFGDYAHKSPLLQAADFIKNVSSVFQGANAQVITGPSQRFIIKGIRPRHAPMDPKGRVYSRCRWISPGSPPCDQYQLKPRHMLEHIARVHLQIERKEGGGWNIDSNNEKLPKDCYWSNCRHFERRTGSSPNAKALGLHVKTHLPDVSTKSAYRQKHNRKPATQVVPFSMIDGDIRPATTPDIDREVGREATHKQLIYQSTGVDELGNAAGIPLTSALILRNLARNTPKAVAMIEGVDHDVVRLQAMEEVFGPVKERLMYVIAHNRVLAGYASDVMAWIERGMAS